MPGDEGPGRTPDDAERDTDGLERDEQGRIKPTDIDFDSLEMDSFDAGNPGECPCARVTQRRSRRTPGEG